MNNYEKVKQEWETTQGQIADMRVRLVAERKQHEDAIKAIDALMASMPGAKVKAPRVEPVAPEAPKGPTLKAEIVDLAKSQPGITTAQLVASLAGRPKKSVENTASRLVSEGKLTRDGKGYAVAS